MNLIKQIKENQSTQRWGAAMAAFLLFGVLLILALLSYQSVTAAGMLPVSINSDKLADYSADQFGFSSPVPTIHVEQIIQAIIEDEQPTNVPERLATLEAILLTPVPTATPAPTKTPTPLPGTPFTPVSALDTATPTSTISLFGTVLPSQTATLLPGVTPPTATQTQIPTNTPTLTPTAKNKPTERALTATAAAAASATNTPVPTATTVPSNTPIPSSTPIPTNTSTTIPTRTPTMIPTATVAVCTAPDPTSGFVDSTTPDDGATNVSRTGKVEIQFNQAMDPKEVTRQVRISGPGGVRFNESYNGNTHTVTFTLLRDLRANTTYELTIKSRITNSCGQRQGTDVVITFTTGP